MVIRRRAVILIDAIVGTILLGIALAVIIGLGAQALSAQAVGEELQTVAMLLDERLNTVLALGPEEYSGRNDTEGACDAPFEAFHYRIELSGGQSGDPYTVTVTISWRSGARARAESVRTTIAPRLGDVPDPVRAPQEAVPRWE